MAKTTALILFYRHHCIIPLVISAGCCILYCYEQDIVQQALTKLFTNAVILYFIAGLRKERLWFYYNLHASRRLLFAGYFIVDLLIFSICLWLTTLIHR